MTDLATLRTGVRRSLPEISRISDHTLGEQVVDAWAIALHETEFLTIEDIPASAHPHTAPLTNGTQATHLRGVARMALAMADELEDLLGPIGVDRDLVIAGGLCHDVGKAWEFSPANLQRWRENPARAGLPSLRHPVYGAHIALSAGLPEEVVHATAAHSAEGELIERSLETTLIHWADYAFWSVAERAGLLGNESDPSSG